MGLRSVAIIPQICAFPTLLCRSYFKKINTEEEILPRSIARDAVFQTQIAPNPLKSNDERNYIAKSVY